MSPFQLQAAMMFPKTARTGNIRGDGAFAILNKCGRRWVVWLYPTAESRAAKLTSWRQAGCGYGCTQQHQTLEIRPDLDWMAKKLEEKQGHWKKQC